MTTPQEGQHHDLFNIQALFEGLIAWFQKSGIDSRGIFLNGDAEFRLQRVFYQHGA